ncbi:hypothetical protein TEA_017701 [Camellia sinensis var. sinensis]|uniref:Uncharacterized protein n=1 Tax=Camellia sinensis var. sinensis TaxID=542762 RepID=A0A4S4CY06_CAMSN|nr:hypothetical protein TEA_017701 [Camellia sinensis var. sinensis]
MRFYYESGTGKRYRSRSQAWARYYETQQQLVVFVPKEEKTFYYEPGTGKRYRSCSQAWARYYETQQQIGVLVPKEENMAHDPNMMEFSKMKNRTKRFNVNEILDSVTWVLTDIEFDKWTPYIDDEMVLQNEQKLWIETFELAMLWKHWPDGKGIYNIYTSYDIIVSVNVEEEEENDDEQTNDLDVQKNNAA